nr:late embryogenesis abundant protein LEA45 [Pinus tabuliformis]
MERKEGGKVLGNAEFVRRRRKRRILCCCGSTVALLLLFVIVCVILAVTVFKGREPKVTVNSVALKGFVFNFDATQLKLNFSVSLDVNLSIENPNKASFKFGNGTTQLLYRGTNIGEGNIPAVEIGSDGTITMNVIVTVLPDQVLSNGNAISDALAGSFPISSWTRIPGRVNFLNIFKHHAVSYTSCNISIAVPSGSLTTPLCTYSVKL